MISSLRSAVGNLTHILRTLENKQWPISEPTTPEEHLGPTELKEVYLLFRGFPICTSELLTELRHALTSVSFLTERVPAVQERFQDLLRRRWLISSPIQRKDIDGGVITQWVVSGVGSVDSRLLEALENAVEEEISKLQQLDLPPPEFRIDLLTDRCIAAGLPIEGMSSPQPKPTPETDGTPCHYHELPDGRFLRICLKSGATLSREQLDTLSKQIERHSVEILQYEPLFRKISLAAKSKGIDPTSIRFTPSQDHLRFPAERLVFERLGSGYVEMHFSRALSREQRKEVQDLITDALGNPKPNQDATTKQVEPMKIFLSHKGANKSLVRKYHKALKELGFDPWLDEDAMPAGTSLERGLLDGMKASCAAVFFITPEFKDEGYLRTEVEYAVQEKRAKNERFAIIPIVFQRRGRGDGSVPELLRGYVHQKCADDLTAMYEITRALPIALGSPQWKK